MVRPRGEVPAARRRSCACMPSTRKRAPARTSRSRSTAARKKPTRAKAKTTRRAKSSGAFSWGDGLLPRGLGGFTLGQRGRDVIGLALVAVGVFMGFVLWGDWDGGRAGHGLAVAFGWTLGRARVLAPLALIAGGRTLLVRQMVPGRRA